MTLEKDENLEELVSGKFVLAISGGVDSVCLLDMVAKTFKDANKRFLVAHADHGIRQNSDWDARFVVALAEKYGLKSKVKKLRLGAKASEGLARDKRYQYLKSLKFGPIVTAHHQDDLVETTILNLTRGTHRRGLISLKSDQHIVRPLLRASKLDLINYAVKNHLEWLEDETNVSPRYRRNRLRQKLSSLEKSNPNFKKQLQGIQKSLNDSDAEIDELSGAIISNLMLNKTPLELDRSKFISLEPTVRREVIMQIFRRLAGDSLSNINRQTILKTEHFICTARAFKNYSPVKGLVLVVDNSQIKISKNL